MSATDKLLLFIKNLDPLSAESLVPPLSLFEESLLFSFASLFLSPMEIIPRFLDKDVYQEEQSAVLVSLST